MNGTRSRAVIRKDLHPPKFTCPAAGPATGQAYVTGFGFADLSPLLKNLKKCGGQSVGADGPLLRRDRYSADTASWFVKTVITIS
jgi:hypothetical protein